MKMLFIVFLFASHLAFGQNARKSEIKIEGHLEKNITDTIRLCIWENYFDETYMFHKIPHTEEETVCKNGNFSFLIKNVNHPMYIFIGYGRVWGTIPYKTWLPISIVEPGDNISISRLDTLSEPLRDGSLSKDFHMNINGKGSAKYVCNLKILKERREMQDKNEQLFLSGKQKHFTSGNFLEHLKYTIGFFTKMKQVQLKILECFKAKISNQAYYLMKADLIGKYDSGALSVLIGEAYKDKVQPNQINKLKSFFYQQKFKDKLNPKNPLLPSSANYISYLTAKTSIYKFFNIHFDGKSFVDSVRRKYNGKLRDRIIAYYLLTHDDDLNGKKNTDKLIVSINNLVNDTLTKLIIRDLSNGAIEGSKAYNFKLYNEKGQMCQLSDFKGKIVLIDFWYTGCLHCVEYYNDVLSKIEDEFRDDKEVKFITINIDASKELWLKSINSGSNLGHYTSGIAENLHANAIGKYDNVITSFNIIGYPSAYLIDRNGVIISTNQDMQNGLRNYYALRKAIDTLKNRVN